jgi:hypothetical protein
VIWSERHEGEQERKRERYRKRMGGREEKEEWREVEKVMRDGER